LNDAAGEARKIIGRLPLFDGMDAQSLTVRRLGGLTNLVFQISDGTTDWCLRIPGKGTEDYIDRKVEAVNARAAAAAGVSPAVLYCDPESGVMVTEFIPDVVTMTPASFRERAGSPARAGRAFHKLHNGGQRFDFRFELFAMIDDYLKHLDKLGAELPEGYHDVVAEAQSPRAALEANPKALAPCHCDPLCENFLDDGASMWIVDWEYSGMNDPLWDLGDLSVEAGFDKAQDEEMMTAYFAAGGTEPSAADWGRMTIYKAMCDLLWTLWGLIQHANKNPAEDFWAYSIARFDRCKALMADPEFARHIKAVESNA
jgi:thiamine kinase-like enzyme